MSKNRKKRDSFEKDIQDDLNVRKNLKKLESKNKHFYTVTNDDTLNDFSDKIKFPNSNSDTNNNTSNLMDIQGPLERKYEKLKEDFYGKVEKIEDKINKKFSDVHQKYVTLSLFKWIIGGLLAILAAIVSMFYVLSYTNLIEDVKMVKNEEIRNSQEIKNIQGNTLKESSLKIKDKKR